MRNGQQTVSLSGRVCLLTIIKIITFFCRCEFFDMNRYDSIESIEKGVFDAHLMANDLCLLEYDAREAPIADIDAYVNAAHARLSRSSILGVLMCSQEKSVLYLNVKA